MPNVRPAAVAFACGLLASAGAHVQVFKSGYVLPLNLALEAALEAMRTCVANG